MFFASKGGKCQRLRELFKKRQQDELNPYGDPGDPIREKIRKKRDGNQDDLIFIGVHVRLKDYPSYMHDVRMCF